VRSAGVEGRHAQLVEQAAEHPHGDVAYEGGVGYACFGARHALVQRIRRAFRLLPNCTGAFRRRRRRRRLRLGPKN